MRIPRVWLHTLFLALALLALAGCAAKGPGKTSSPTSGAYDAKMLEGLWSVDGSTAVFEITVSGGAVSIEGWDTIEREQAFDISKVSWDGKVLRGTFLFAPNNFTTISTLTFEPPDVLRGHSAGDYVGDEVWHRLKEGEMPGLNGAPGEDEPEGEPEDLEGEGNEGASDGQDAPTGKEDMNRSK